MYFQSITKITPFIKAVVAQNITKTSKIISKFSLGHFEGQQRNVRNRLKSYFLKINCIGLNFFICLCVNVKNKFLKIKIYIILMHF